MEELATVIELQDPFIDCENEYEWVIGSCDGVDLIDICRTHLVQPLETDTTILRYAHGIDRVIPKTVIQNIAKRLIATGIHDIEVSGFDAVGSQLTAQVQSELGL